MISENKVLINRIDLKRAESVSGRTSCIHFSGITSIYKPRETVPSLQHKGLD